MPYASAETPQGSVNGTNVTFTLANAPNPAASLQLYSGILLTQGSDYTLSGNVITFVVAPSAGSNLQAFYAYAVSSTSLPLSGSFWTPDILTICQEAAERAGVDMTGAYLLRSAKRSIDILMAQWANKGLNLWTIDEQTTTLAAGTATYLLPPDTVDLIYPSIRTAIGGYQEDITIAREDFSDYAAIPNKTQQGKPSVVYVQRMTAQPQAYLWLVPDAVTPYTLVWWRLRRMQAGGVATNGLDLPWRLVPAMISGLAWLLSLKKPIKDFVFINLLKQTYEQDLLEALREDRDRSEMRVTPATDYWC